MPSIPILQLSSESPRIYHLYNLPPSSSVVAPKPNHHLVPILPSDTNQIPLNVPPAFTISVSNLPPDLEPIRALFTSYTTALGIDLKFQSFAAELASLPGKYAEPAGCLLLARTYAPSSPRTESEVESAPHADDDDATIRTTSPSSGDGSSNEASTPVGCAALRPLPYAPSPSSPSSASPQRPKKRAEIKRLYAAPEARGTGLGSALCAAVVAEARRRGYDEVVLDTLPSMGAARAIYARMGFEATAAYYETPLEGTEFLRLDLR